VSKRIWLGLAMTCVLLAGCGATTAKTADSATPTATAPQPTATATPTPLPTASASQLAACNFQGVTGVLRLGDLLVGKPVLEPWAHPSRQLPDGTPLAPFHLAAPSGAALDTQLPPDPAASPYMAAHSGGYELAVCNSSSSQTHVLKGISVRIESAAPYSGQLSAWEPCDGYYYDASTKQLGGGCAFSGCDDEFIEATFPSAPVGATVATVQAAGKNCSEVPAGPLPLSLRSHQSIYINVGVVAPSAPTTYTFALGLVQDGADAVFLPATKPVLLAAVAHKWTGAACLAPAMKAQIPAASSSTYYICPEA